MTQINKKSLPKDFNIVPIKKNKNDGKIIIAVFYKDQSSQYHLEFSCIRTVGDKSHDFG